MQILTRSQVIANLRRELLKLVDGERSICLVAHRRGLFCNGFGRWSTEELVRRFPGLDPRGMACTRDELEKLANREQLARQDVRAGRLPCDERSLGDLPCAGWNSFSDEELARFHLEMRGEDVRIVADPTTIEGRPLA